MNSVQIFIKQPKPQNYSPPVSERNFNTTESPDMVSCLTTVPKTSLSTNSKILSFPGIPGQAGNSVSEDPHGTQGAQVGRHAGRLGRKQRLNVDSCDWGESSSVGMAHQDRHAKGQLVRFHHSGVHRAPGQRREWLRCLHSHEQTRANGQPGWYGWVKSI